MSFPIENYLICRTCLLETGEMTDVFNIEQFEHYESKICDVINLCASVQVCKGDGLPEQVCFQCIEDLRHAFLFRKRCEKSDATLRQLLVSTSNGKKDIKLEHNVEIKVEGTDFIASDQEDAIEDNESYNKELDKVFHINASLHNNLAEFRNDKQAENTNDDEENAADTSIVGKWHCQKCNVTFKTRAEFRIHKKKKFKRWHCRMCDVNFDTRYNYRRHMRVEHKKIQCVHCRRRFETKSSLDNHVCNSDDETEVKKLPRVIKKDAPRTCTVCDKTFRTPSDLERHSLTHTLEKPFLCNTCGKGFTRRYYLKVHAGLHNRNSPFRCDICKKNLINAYSLAAHMRLHTGEKPYVCHICGKNFRQSGDLTTHIRVHTGARMSECEVCHKRFARASHLARHMRTHTGEKPFVCKDCDRTFTTKEVLKAHMRVHTGERPYSCIVCDRAFAKMQSLNSHKRVHQTST